LGFTRAGFNIVECWAARLGNCAGGLSREHYISDGIFDGETIAAFGLAWCKERPIQIGLVNAVSKILCKRHNEALSAFDAEAAKLSRFLSKNIVDDPLSEAEIALNGPSIEKWALKTFVNLGYIGGLDQEHHSRIQPAPAIVDFLFRGGDVPRGIGLYFLTGAISNEDYNVGLSWNAIHNVSDGGAVVAMTFTLNKIRFVVSAEPGPVEERLAKMGVVKGVDYSNAKIVYRPENISFLSKTEGQKTVILEW